TSATGTPVATTTTADNGTYSFTVVAPGTYFVQEAVPAGYTQTGGNAGYAITVAANDVSSGNNFDDFKNASITGPQFTDVTGTGCTGGVGSSGTSSGNNFANFQNASISGAKSTDKTGDGFSPDDTVLGGVTINLYQGSVATGTPYQTALTAADGSYSFTNLAP